MKADISKSGDQYRIEVRSIRESYLSIRGAVLYMDALDELETLRDQLSAFIAFERGCAVPLKAPDPWAHWDHAE